MTDPDVRDALSDLDALTLTLFGEARGEPVEGMIAVASLIRNRLKTPRRFGVSYRAVCHARAQFSCWWQFGGAENYHLVYMLARAIVDREALPLSPTLVAIYSECQYVAEGVIGERLRDRVKQATHYYAPLAMVPVGRVPDWAAGVTPVAKVGGHLFFVGIK